jgi:hypothetical protein
VQNGIFCRVAIGCYQDSLAICRETGDRYGEGQTLTNLGIAYTKMRQPDRAAMCWREAAAAMRDAGDDEAAGRWSSVPRTSGPGAPLAARRLTSDRQSVGSRISGALAPRLWRIRGEVTQPIMYRQVTVAMPAV